jgi:AcrR family transcriptional regulator
MVAQRNAEQTREKILAASFDMIYKNGYQGMRVDQILKATGLAKGALYHHFKNKQSLGYAVVDELLMADMQRRWVEPLSRCDNPLQGIKNILDTECDAVPQDMLKMGCPLNNLSQEMAGLDDGFHQRLEQIYHAWSGAISDALIRGQQQNLVRNNIDPPLIAAFIISSMQGIIGTMKCVQDKQMLLDLKSVLVDYVLSLKA